MGLIIDYGLLTRRNVRSEVDLNWRLGINQRTRAGGTRTSGTGSLEAIVLDSRRRKSNKTTRAKYRRWERPPI